MLAPVRSIVPAPRLAAPALLALLALVPVPPPAEGTAPAVPATASPPAAPAATDTTPEARPMSIVDLLEVPTLDDPRLSPDGSRLLYVRGDASWEENRRIEHVWLAETDGGDAVQLTRGEEGQSSPRWSPDGGRVAFLAERGEDEGRQIWLIRPDGGEAWRLTEHATDVSDIAWSPAGEWIYFRAEDPETEAEKAREEAKNDVYPFSEDYRHRHLWRVDPATGSEERLTEGEWSVWDYALSRDGSRIAFHRGPTPLFDDWSETEVWVMDAGGLELTRVTRNGVFESGARLSPDGSRVAFTSRADRSFEFYYNTNLFVAPVPEPGSAAASQGVDPEEVRLLLPDMPHGVDAAEWSADGSALYFLANTGVRRELFRVEAESEELTRLTEGRHALSDWTYLPEQGRHVFRISTPTSPGEVWRLEAGAGAPAEPVRLTRVYEGLEERFRLPRQEAITWKGADGTTVEGLLFYPLDYEEGKRYPAVVQTHGGPASSDKFGFGSSYDYPQVLTARGWFVFQPNYRGSTGYGDAFLRDMVGHYFHQAHRDVMTGVDALIERGLVDGDRLAKMGWSAGGHMTNWIITWTDRFAAASSGAGAANWISMYGQSDVRTYRTPWFGGTPWEEDSPIDVYWENSPLSNVGRVSTPTLFLVGENDRRVPMPQSVEMYRGVRHAGVPTHLYVAPREGHGWDELRHRLFKVNVELDWFERHVRGRDYEWEVAPGDGEEEAVTAPAQARR